MSRALTEHAPTRRGSLAGDYTTFVNPSANDYTRAYGLNDMGQIVGTYVINTGGSFEHHGFLLSSFTYSTIDPPLSTGLGTEAWGIYDAGQITAAACMIRPTTTPLQSPS